MKAVTDSEGKIVIDLRKGDTAISFKVGALDGVPFPPCREVEIPDDRLNATIDVLLAPFGFSSQDRVWGSTAN